jgi:hypothetical protein
MIPARLLAARRQGFAPESSSFGARHNSPANQQVPHCRGRCNASPIGADAGHVPLHHVAIVETPVLDNVPIEVHLAVLPSSIRRGNMTTVFNRDRELLGISV